MGFEIDRTVCIGAGTCVIKAPAVFAQDPDDGLVVPVGGGVPDSPEVRRAAEACPSGAIVPAP
ncbi:ferredoxin [Nocardiopsis sp. N85]|uniref:ferredoxin n=1 Tax=Nocardiopsis sp. N85 TaxID=3029400 RepID=UPI00237F3D8D|nr:ferredoxin [Nocardiopsis sp. N85]MDE3720705.1 ferredoxin [Nocardiopsis sp. N85]